MFDFMDMGFDEPGEPIGSGPYIPDAGECMRCGICIASYPTFRLFQIDEETPRRRIRTISKAVSNNESTKRIVHEKHEKHEKHCNTIFSVTFSCLS